MGRIPARDIESVKEETNIVEVISAYIPLKKTGQTYKALCPFHHEKTPSFMVNGERQIYHCFGCGAGGNVFEFAMRYEKIEFPEAVRLLAGRAGIQLTASDENKKEEDKSEPIYRALEQACILFQNKFPKSTAEKYIKKRGINDDTIAQFRLGYAPDSWEFLFPQMKEKFDAGILEQAGLVRKRQKSEGYYDWFGDRIMFPIFNSSGRIVGFGARVLDDSKKDAPKYLNSPESPIFSKGKLLYGMNFASKSAREKNQLIVIEGYTDVLNLHQAGIENSAASIGSALTPLHIQMLEKKFPGLEELVLCFDNDAAGRRAALNAGENTLGRIPTKVCLLPEGEDPASLMEKGGNFLEYIGKSVHFFDFYIGEKKKGINFDVLEGRIAFLKHSGVKELYKKVPQNMQGLFVETLAQKTGMGIDAIEQAFGENKRMPGAQPYREAVYEKRMFWERKFLAQLIAANNQDTIKYFSGIDEKIFCTKEAQAIFAYLMNGSKQDIFNFGMPLFRKETLEKMLGEINSLAMKQGDVLNDDILISFFEAVQEQKDKFWDIGFSSKMVARNYYQSIMEKLISEGVSYKEFEQGVREARITKGKGKEEGDSQKAL